MTSPTSDDLERELVDRCRRLLGGQSRVLLGKLAVWVFDNDLSVRFDTGGHLTHANVYDDYWKRFNQDLAAKHAIPLLRANQVLDDLAAI